MHAFVDESARGGRYLICAVMVSPSSIDETRQLMRTLRRPGQSRLHFVKESDRRRRAILSELTRAGVNARVYRTQSKGNRVSQREAARAVCLESFVTDAGASLLSLTLESRAELDHYDLSTLHGAVQRNGVQFTYEHVDPHKEPILSADAVVWAAGGSRDWRRRIESIAVVDRRI